MHPYTLHNCINHLNLTIISGADLQRDLEQKNRLPYEAEAREEVVQRAHYNMSLKTPTYNFQSKGNSLIAFAI